MLFVGNQMEYIIINLSHYILVRFGERKIAKERFYAAKTSVKIWDVNGANTVISKIVKKN